MTDYLTDSFKEVQLNNDKGYCLDFSLLNIILTGAFWHAAAHTMYHYELF